MRVGAVGVSSGSIFMLEIIMSIRTLKASFPSVGLLDACVVFASGWSSSLARTRTLIEDPDSVILILKQVAKLPKILKQVAKLPKIM